MITIYTKPTCGYCFAAKELMAGKGLAFEEVDVVRDTARRAEMVERSGGRMTVPQIFVGGRHVGGYDDLYALEKAGRLDALVADAAQASGPGQGA